MRALKNNNLWNLKTYDLNDPWKGYPDSGHTDSEGHAIFYCREMGGRAVVRDLFSKSKQGINTVFKLIQIYSPSSDTIGSINGNDFNNPEEAAETIVELMKEHLEDKDISLDVHTSLDFFESNGSICNEEILIAFLMAWAEQEICRGFIIPIETIYSIFAIYEYDFVKD